MAGASLAHNEIFSTLGSPPWRGAVRRGRRQDRLPTRKVELCLYWADLSSAYTCVANRCATVVFVLPTLASDWGTLESKSAQGFAAIMSVSLLPSLIIFEMRSRTPSIMSRCAITAVRSTVGPCPGMILVL